MVARDHRHLHVVVHGEEHLRSEGEEGRMSGVGKSVSRSVGRMEVWKQAYTAKVGLAFLVCMSETTDSLAS